MHQIEPKRLDDLCLMLGFLSIFASIATWFYTRGREPLTQAHGEHFGIFVGPRAPIFFILSDRFARCAEKPVERSFEIVTRSVHRRLIVPTSVRLAQDGLPAKAA